MILSPSENSPGQVTVSLAPEELNVFRSELRQALENKTLNRCPNLRNFFSLFLAATTPKEPEKPKRYGVLYKGHLNGIHGAGLWLWNDDLNQRFETEVYAEASNKAHEFRERNPGHTYVVEEISS